MLNFYNKLTADLDFGVVVVRKGPVTVCSQCGADWIEDSIARQPEDIVKDARKSEWKKKLPLSVEPI